VPKTVARKSFRMKLSLAMAGLWMVLLASDPACADLDFQFTYEAASSAPPTFNGIVDQNGAVLTSMMNSAASVWSDLIADDWTINVAVRWQMPTIGPTFSGQMSLDVLTDTTIIAHQFDLDGDTEADHTTTIHSDAVFTINSSQIDESGGTFGDTIVIQDNAQLAVNTDSSWNIDNSGILRFDGAAVANPLAILTGQSLANRGLIEGNGDLDVNVTNQGGIIRPGQSAGVLRFARFANNTARSKLNWQVLRRSPNMIRSS